MYFPSFERISNFINIQFNLVMNKFIGDAFSKQMVVVNPATPSLNGQLVTVQGRVHELIVQLRKEQETSKRLSLELETARTALDEANKRLLQTPTNKHQLNQEGI